jgi:hypothetical protein
MLLQTDSASGELTTVTLAPDLACNQIEDSSPDPLFAVLEQTGGELIGVNVVHIMGRDVSLPVPLPPQGAHVLELGYAAETQPAFDGYADVCVDLSDGDLLVTGLAYLNGTLSVQSGLYGVAAGGSFALFHPDVIREAPGAPPTADFGRLLNFALGHQVTAYGTNFWVDFGLDSGEGYSLTISHTRCVQYRIAADGTVTLQPQDGGAPVTFRDTISYPQSFDPSAHNGDVGGMTISAETGNDDPWLGIDPVQLNGCSTGAQPPDDLGGEVPNTAVPAASPGLTAIGTALVLVAFIFVTLIFGSRGRNAGRDALSPR